MLAVLVARAGAGTLDDEADDLGDRDGSERDAAADRDSRSERDGDLAGVTAGGARRARRLYVPITNAMIARIATFAPPVARVVAAAYRAAGLADDPTPSWRRRSRWSALVPLVSVRAGQNQAWRDVDDPTVSHGVAVDVRATWRLDQLIFDRDEPRIASLDVARRRERRRVALHTVEVYFAWVSARAAGDADMRAELDAEQRLAELDALTDGWFSQALAKAAESR
jgi:hypothetical protein